MRQRFIKSVIGTAASCTVVLPWARQTRRAPIIVPQKRVDVPRRVRRA